jgi:hypothetical protein
MDKSHVSMETKLCVVCGKEYDSGAILLDKRLRASMERHTCTGFGMCKEHEKLRKDGYTAVIAIDESKTTHKPGGALIDPQEAHRTGAILHVKKRAWVDLFPEVPWPEKGVIFAPDHYVDHIAKMMEGQS